MQSDTDRMTNSDKAPTAEQRDPLALAMFAAWCNIPADKLPATMRAHTCPATAEAWGRVAEAARAALLGPEKRVARGRGLSRRIGETGLSIETGAQWPWTYNLLCGDQHVASFDFTGWQYFRSMITPKGSRHD